MKNKILKYAVFLIALMQVCCSQPTTTTVTVVGEDGLPIEGAKVGVTYSLNNKKYVSGKGSSDADGKYSFTGKSFYRYDVAARKEGYYESRSEGIVYNYNQETKTKEYISPKVTLTLREIRNPIPMYAISRPEMEIPKYGKKIGFDLEKADWVAPYGKGKSADVFFQADGYYNGRKDFDYTVTLSFPNEGDGFVTFEGEERKGSHFISPYEAPLDGYTAQKKWRRMRISEEKAKELGEPKRFIGTHPEKGLNFILRVQTVLDLDGNVIRAKYAKIYGDIQFYGVKPDNLNVGVLISRYYFNPTTNDRNLEYAVGQNLFKNLRSTRDPKLP